MKYLSLNLRQIYKIISIGNYKILIRYKIMKNNPLLCWHSAFSDCVLFKFCASSEERRFVISNQPHCGALIIFD